MDRVDKKGYNEQGVESITGLYVKVFITGT